MKCYSRRKKASISLSINAIVVVVLAFVMLGLGLALTRGIFTNLQDQTGQISEQVRQQVLDDLRSGNKPLSFTQNNINVQYGSNADIVIGIKNTGDSTRNYCMKWESFDEAGTALAPDDAIEFSYIKSIKTLSPSNTEVIPIKLLGSGISQGLYQGQLTVYSAATDQTTCSGTYDPATWSVHASKSFFVNVQ